MVLSEIDIEWLYIGGRIYDRAIPGYSKYTITLCYYPTTPKIQGVIKGKKGHLKYYCDNTYDNTYKKYYKLKDDKGKTKKLYIDDIILLL